MKELEERDVKKESKGTFNKRTNEKCFIRQESEPWLNVAGGKKELEVDITNKINEYNQYSNMM